VIAISNNTSVTGSTAVWQFRPVQ